MCCQTWEGHLSAYLKDDFSLCCSLSHGADDVLVRSIHHRQTIDVGYFISDLESAVHVCRAARDYGSHCRLVCVGGG